MLKLNMERNRSEVTSERPLLECIFIKTIWRRKG